MALILALMVVVAGGLLALLGLALYFTRDWGLLDVLPGLGLLALATAYLSMLGAL